MNKIEKLLRKITKRDRIFIQIALQFIFKRDYKNLQLTKLKSYRHIYRARVGNYRIIYFDDGKEIIIKYIRKRDESTYKQVL